MDLNILNQMIADAAHPKAAENTVSYIAEHLQSYVRRGDRVLICFSNSTFSGLGWLMEQAVLRCDGVPVIWGPDYRWKTVLQQAFYKLLRCTGRTAAAGEGKGLGLGIQLDGVDGNAAALRQLMHNVQIQRLSGLGKIHRQPESVGQRHQLLHGVVAVYVIGLCPV